MDVNAGTLIVPNIDTPASYAPKALEPYEYADTKIDP